MVSTPAILLVASVAFWSSDLVSAACQKKPNVPMCMAPVILSPNAKNLAQFQSITPLVLTTDTADGVKSKLQLAHSICDLLNATKYCFSANKSQPVDWWHCPHSLDGAYASLMGLAMYFPSSGNDSLPPKDEFIKVLALINDLCFSEYNLPAILADQQCLTTAMSDSSLSGDRDTLNPLFTPHYHFQSSDCGPAQTSVGNLVNAVRSSCGDYDARLVQAVFKGAFTLVLDYQENDCPLNFI